MELRCFKSQFDSPSSLLLSDPRLSQCLVSAALKRQSQIENRFLHNPFLILAKGYVRSSKISLEPYHSLVFSIVVHGMLHASLDCGKHFIRKIFIVRSLIVVVRDLWGNSEYPVLKKLIGTITVVKILHQQRDLSLFMFSFAQ
ncbi:hypothetical protein M758_4G190300 [Ceratodon purpureus]|nr:hypothetical protein M758_4G190300 [Ceratodon purpureus]